MGRDQRVQDNWALLHAAELAEAHSLPLSVVFCLPPPAAGSPSTGPGSTLREYGFMLKGLREVSTELAALRVPFCLLHGGSPPELLSQFCAQHEVAVVVADYSPLREPRGWKEALIAARPATPVLEVDAHNVVPVWVASDKREVGARTIRKKITEKLPQWLVDIPALPPRAAADPQPPAGLAAAAAAMDWVALEAGLQLDRAVAEVDWCKPGAAAALAAVDAFCDERLKLFADKRNDPNIAACSDLSPYLHFGQLSAQRMALCVKQHAKARSDSVASFLEESIVRRELSDNFCHYEPAYDSLDGAAGWARESLELHASDKREHVYSLEQLEGAQTHEDLWNAAQRQLAARGKMHGFMRMYWAKKILEWTASPAEALRIGLYLNDKYSIDGRDPNGYVGVGWSVMGVHDMGWAERAVFGKIRYMNYNGCKRKFDVKQYVAEWSGKKAAAGSTSAGAKSASAGRAKAGGKAMKQTTLGGGSTAAADDEPRAKAPPPKKPKLAIPI
uniref:Deoxyribodipyrimidine photo-lyase n=2 Tax=Emiliania huxleyi TaxID=2903 RepID=A0A7S3TGV0_EMIHU